MKSTVAIIGAGPAGLTAAYLLSKNKVDVTVLEADPIYVGGISRTSTYKGFHFDIGGHRFFSKSKAVEDLWTEILPNDMLQRPRSSKIYYDGKFFTYPLKPFEALMKLGIVRSTVCVLSWFKARLFPIRHPRNFRSDIGGHRFFSKSKAVEDLWTEILPNDMLQRPRSSKIYYDGKFFTYPLKPFEALMKLGIVRSTVCVLSWFKARLFPIRHPRNFEEWVSNQFGKRLFNIFFKSYTEKVWGMSCKEISADWAAQRIRGLSLGSAIKNAFFKKRPANGDRTKETKTFR